MNGKPIYRIKNWDSLYENNRTRSMVNMQWVPVTNRQDGDGYTALVDRDDGAAYLGCWLAILQVASRCSPRGTLVRDGGIPHDAISLSRITRLPVKILESAISVLIDECKWLEINGQHEGDTQPAPSCAEGDTLLTPSPHPTDEEGRKERRNGIEGNERRKEYLSGSRVALHYLNEKAGKHFRETDANLKLISNRLEEVGCDLAGVKQMIDRQCAKWKGDAKMDEYLRPETLFNKTKFSGYYDNRDLPVNPARQTESNQLHENIQVRSL